MDFQEFYTLFQSADSSPFAVIPVILYFLIMNWAKLKSGLGFDTNKSNNLNLVEKNYHLLKLKVEIEQSRIESKISDARFKELENEMLQRLKNTESSPFTGPQKYIAIPLVLVIFSYEFLASTEYSRVDLWGYIIFLVIIYSAFWALPVLRLQKNSLVKKLGFITFWSIILYLCMALLLTEFIDIFNVNADIEEYYLLLYTIALLITTLLGFNNILPFQKLLQKKKKETEEIINDDEFN